MWKKAVLLGVATGTMIILTRYGVSLLVLSNKLRDISPAIATTMEHVADGLSGKTLTCADRLPAPSPGNITFVQVQALAEEYGRFRLEVDEYEMQSSARILVENDFSVTDGVRHLRDSLSAFGASLREWLSACSGPDVTPEIRKKLAATPTEMKKAIVEYRKASSENDRRVRQLSLWIAIAITFDVALLLLLLRLGKKLLNTPVRVHRPED